MNDAAAAVVLRALRHCIPTLTILFLILAGGVPVALPYHADVVPWLPLMGLYYWVMFRPDLMPRAVVFALGIVHDALSGAPFGLMALVFLLVHGFVLTQRRFIVGKPFWIFWAGFAIVAPVAVLLAWLLASALRGTLLPGDATVVALALTVVCFPLVSWLLVRSQRWLVGSAEDA